MYSRTLKVLFSCLSLLPTLGFSQESPNTNNTGQAPGQLRDSVSTKSKPYEITITPTITRTDLRGFIQNVEDDFFARFNELNIDKNYDIVCYKMTPTMSHISQRVCEPLFLMKTRNENASESTFQMGTQYATGPFGGKIGAGMPPVVLSPKALRRKTSKDFEILQEKMEELNRTDEELRSIGSVLAQLKGRLENFEKEDR